MIKKFNNMEGFWNMLGFGILIFLTFSGITLIVWAKGGIC